MKIFRKHICLILVIIGLLWQTACVAVGNSTSNGENSAVEKVVKAEFPSPLETDFEREKTEAQRLVDNGISFKNTMSAHGMMTEKGVSFGSNEFESSDGVKLSRYGKLYETPEELKRAFDAALKGAAKVFEKEDLENGERRFTGISGSDALIVNTSGHYLYTVKSPSVRHLLAFEIKEAHYFSYKSAK